MNNKEYLLDLDKKRHVLEKTIIELTDFLNQDGWPGVDKPLIDEQGYPLPGLDLFSIREARQKLIMTQNDHKSLMHLIEEKMSEYFKLQRENNKEDTNNKEFVFSKNPEDEDKHLVQVFEDDIQEKQIRIPFAYVNSVIVDSPAYKAGLRDDDGIISFCDITSTMQNPLEKVSLLVRSNENKEIKLIIVKKGQLNTSEITLLPQKWEGNGLLGCRLVLK